MGRKKREANNSKSKTIIVQKWIGKKKWEANKSKKNWHLEWDGKNGKQIDQKKRWHLEGLQEKNGHLTNMDWKEKIGSKQIQKKLAS